jgi:hypothetical protein
MAGDGARGGVVKTEHPRDIFQILRARNERGKE